MFIQGKDGKRKSSAAVFLKRIFQLGKKNNSDNVSVYFLYYRVSFFLSCRRYDVTEM